MVSTEELLNLDYSPEQIEQAMRLSKKLAELESEFVEDDSGYLDTTERKPRPYQQEIIDKLNDFFEPNSLNKEFIDSIQEWVYESRDTETYQKPMLELLCNSLENRAMGTLGKLKNRPKQPPTTGKALVKLATGGGKTFTALSYIKQSGFEKAYVIQHRDDPLRRQWEAEAELLGVEIEVLSIQYLLGVNGFQFIMDNWVKITSDNMISFRPNKKTILILDEAHHYFKNTWAKIVDSYWQGAILGLTATPFRTDSAFRFIEKFDKMIEGPSKQWLINNGFLSPSKVVDANGFVVKGYGVSKKQGSEEGDFVMKKTFKEISKRPDSKEYHQVYMGGIDMLLGEWPDHDSMKCIVFAMTQDHARILKQMFDKLNIPSSLILGDDESRKHRKMAFRMFKVGMVKVLITCMVITEGIDLPPCNVILDLRPTNSYSLYLQKFGRGSRIFPEKEEVLILDPVGNNVRFGHPDDPITIRPGSLSLITPRRNACWKCSGVSRQSANLCEFCGERLGW